MYTNIFFEYHKSIIHLWEKDGDKTVYSTHDYKPSLYSYAPKDAKAPAIDIYGHKMAKIEFTKEAYCRKHAEENFTCTAGYNSPVSKFLTERYYLMSHRPEFFGIELNLLYFDIETFSPNGVPDADTAPDKIVSIGTYNSLRNEYICFAINPKIVGTKTSCNGQKKFIQCMTEEILLRDFISYINGVRPDVLVQYNGLKFDIPILINRCNRLLGEDVTNHLSPIKIIQHNPRSETCHWKIAGMAFLDYMELIKKFKRGEYPSYSLANISKQLLKRPKLPTVFATECMDADCNITNEPKWKEMLQYMMRDVECLVEFEKELKYIKVSQMIYMQGLCEPEQIYGTINYVDGAINAEIYRMGMIPPNKVVIERPTPPKYPGGWVKEPVKGISDWVTTYDINSLYPMSMVSLNISPETKKFKIMDDGIKDDKTEEWSFPFVDKIRELMNGKLIDHPDEPVSVKYGGCDPVMTDIHTIATYIRDNNLILSPCGAVYTQESGIIPNILKEWYAERARIKAKISELKQMGNKDKEIRFLENMENALKVKLNSTYGALGSKFSIFYDLDNAISVTTCGQNIIKHAEKATCEHFKATYGIAKSPVIYIDTDSLFVSYADLVKRDKYTLSDISRDAEVLKTHLNEDYNKFCTPFFNLKKQFFVFKRENVADHILFIGKKLYISHLVEADGELVPEEKSIKAKGMELVKSTTPEQIKPLIKDIVRNILTGNTGKVVQIIKDGKNQIMKMDIEDIARSGGVKNIEKFVDPDVDVNPDRVTLMDNPESVGIYVPELRPAWKKGAPVHVKGAICYNFLTRDMRHKYDEIKSNMKMKYVYLKPNIYGWDAIGFVEKFPTEFGLEVDISRMYDKLVMSMVEKIFDVLGWSVPNMKSINLMSIFETKA